MTLMKRLHPATAMLAGAALLAVAAGWRALQPINSHSNVIDASQGLLFGLAIAIMIQSLILEKRRCKRLNLHGERPMIVDRRLNPATAMRIGMASLIGALLWPRLLHPTAAFGPDLFDATQGLLFGVAIGMNLLSVVLNTRRRCGEGR